MIKATVCYKIVDQEVFQYIISSAETWYDHFSWWKKMLDNLRNIKIRMLQKVMKGPGVSPFIHPSSKYNDVCKKYKRRKPILNRLSCVCMMSCSRYRTIQWRVTQRKPSTARIQPIDLFLCCIVGTDWPTEYWQIRTTVLLVSQPHIGVWRLS